MVDEAWGKEEKTPDDLAAEAAAARHAVNMAKTHAEIEQSVTKAEKSRAERAGLKPRLDSLSPEEHGKLLGNLVADFIRAGVDPARAYTLALRTLNPEASFEQGDKPPAGSQGTQLTDKIVLHILQKALDNLEAGPKPVPVAPNPPAVDNRNPAQIASEVFQQYRNLGEAYMQSIGLDPRQITEMRRKPEGGSFLTGLGANIGGNMDLQIRMMQFEDEQRRRWHEFEQQSKAFDAQTKRDQEEHEERMKSQRVIRKAIEENLGPAIETGREFIERRRGNNGDSPQQSDRRTAVCTECKHPNTIPAGTAEFTCEQCGAELEILG